MPWRNYHILETDYINYALIHTCSVSYGAWTKHETQFLTRSPQKIDTRSWGVWVQVAKGAIQRAFIDSTEVEKHLSREIMQPVMQGRLDCQYPPELDFNQPIVPGEDTSLPE